MGYRWFVLSFCNFLFSSVFGRIPDLCHQAFPPDSQMFIWRGAQYHVARGLCSFRASLKPLVTQTSRSARAVSITVRCRGSIRECRPKRTRADPAVISMRFVTRVEPPGACLGESAPQRCPISSRALAGRETTAPFVRCAPAVSVWRAFSKEPALTLLVVGDVRAFVLGAQPHCPKCGRGYVIARKFRSGRLCI